MDFALVRITLKSADQIIVFNPPAGSRSDTRSSQPAHHPPPPPAPVPRPPAPPPPLPPPPPPPPPPPTLRLSEATLMPPLDPGALLANRERAEGRPTSSAAM